MSPHEHLAERAAVDGVQAVLQLDRPAARAETHMARQVGHPAEVLAPGGDGNAAVAGRDLLGSADDGLGARAAGAGHGERRALERQAGLQRDLAADEGAVVVHLPTTPNTRWSTPAADSPLRRKAALATCDPSCDSGTSRNDFPKSPNAVRTPPSITI